MSIRLPHRLFDGIRTPDSPQNLHICVQELRRLRQSRLIRSHLNGGIHLLRINLATGDP